MRTHLFEGKSPRIHPTSEHTSAPLCTDSVQRNQLVEESFLLWRIIFVENFTAGSCHDFVACSELQDPELGEDLCERLAVPDENHKNGESTNYDVITKMQSFSMRK